MFLNTVHTKKGPVSLPRASGGVSCRRAEKNHTRRSSPRKRGCFRGAGSSQAQLQVFPAQAGVFPVRGKRRRAFQSLPRASGGVSCRSRWATRARQSSPRKRGCFSECQVYRRYDHVFPAQAGVFPEACESSKQHLGLPRASGGVSDALHVSIETRWSSPRKRGCFQNAFLNAAARLVFPAQAGVFLRRIVGIFLFASLPRASGGVSGDTSCCAKTAKSSPRKRGCFLKQ